MDGISITCPVCGATMVWSGDFCREDFEIGDDELVRELHCANCGADATIYETADEEKKNYPYYQEHPEYIRKDENQPT